MTKEEFIYSRYDDYLKYWANVALAFGPFVVLFLIPLDYLVSPINFRAFVAYRFCTAAFLFLLYLFNRGTTSRKRINITIGLSAIAVSAMVALMIADFGGHLSPYAAGFILVGIFVSGIVPLMFSACLISSLIVYAIYIIPILLYDQITNVSHFASVSILIFACISTMLILRYFGNRRLFYEFGLQFDIEEYKAGLEDQVKDRTYQMSQTIMNLEKTEKALKESEERFRSAFEHAAIGYSIYSMDGHFLQVNQAMCRMVGYSEEELKTRTYQDITHPDDQGSNRDHVAQLLSGKMDVVHFQKRYIHKLGHKVWVALSVSVVRNEKGAPLYLISLIEDLTEKRKLEDQLRHAQKMEAIGTLAGGIAHDFNNMLNVILGYGTMVLDELEADSLSKERMNEMLSAADRATNLTRRLLLFSRKEVADFKPMDVNGMVINMEKMLSRIIGEDIRLVTDHMGAKAMVMADGGQMEQVLMNLATNARDAMPKGGSLTIKTELSEMDAEFIKTYDYGVPGTYAVISVTDTGTGIDIEQQKRIFDPFFTTKEVGKGTGLGLSIAYGIIKQHNGYINVYSEPGKGTTFKIWLPVNKDTAEIKPEVDALPSLMGGTETILVAEDDTSLRKMTSTVLEAYGYTVITAEDGEDAINKFMENREKIHLIILDMIMPKKNGKEAYEKIRMADPGIKTLFVTGYAMDSIKTQELTDAGLDFMYKPVSPKDLVKKVREILDRV